MERVRVEGRGGRQGTCPFCREDLEDGAARVTCSACGVAVHTDCAKEHAAARGGSCPTLGCRGSWGLGGGPGRAAPRPPPERVTVGGLREARERPLHVLGLVLVIVFTALASIFGAGQLADRRPTAQRGYWDRIEDGFADLESTSPEVQERGVQVLVDMGWQKIPSVLAQGLRWRRPSPGLRDGLRKYLRRFDGHLWIRNRLSMVLENPEASDWEQRLAREALERQGLDQDLASVTGAFFADDPARRGLAWRHLHGGGAPEIEEVVRTLASGRHGDPAQGLRGLLGAADALGAGATHTLHAVLVVASEWEGSSPEAAALRRAAQEALAQRAGVERAR